MAPGPSARRLAGDPPSPWEGLYGYSRVVCAGPWVMIGGTTSVDPSGAVVGATPREQATEIFRKLRGELSRVGLGVADVVQVRMYVTDISRADEVGRVHGEVFGGLSGGGPVTTMVEVSGLIDPRMLVEIELVAHRDPAAR
ncbi:RidA family protein [Conexibacter sp. S30A1]|uniref:RidA family protein n=1 Tax=Conexibacter sp. S30A1 TaxID=2937800 RepID=UPI00201064EA|nr:RidA family protein [Conexibacter sp. S30A1]